jgi:hypothetical protein
MTIVMLCQYVITAAGRICDSTGRDCDRNLYR